MTNPLGLLATLALMLYAACVLAQDLPRKFDPTRDPAKDVAAAVAQAKAKGKRVLVDVGGEWCKWCHILDRFFESHPDLDAQRERGFVLVKVNWSPENKNAAFLSRWPAVKGYPHLFVLDGDGKLLHSQDTGLLEAGADYDLAKVDAFLRKWAPPRAT
jgi:thiol:disulfide interchange protein